MQIANGSLITLEIQTDSMVFVTVATIANTQNDQSFTLANINLLGLSANLTFNLLGTVTTSNTANTSNNNSNTSSNTSNNTVNSNLILDYSNTNDIINQPFSIKSS